MCTTRVGGGGSYASLWQIVVVLMVRTLSALKSRPLASATLANGESGM